MKTQEMEIELIKYLGVERNLIVTNVSWGIGLTYEADIVCLGEMFATEIEIKVSKSDLLKDKNKKHKHDSKLFRYLYFAVPKHLEEIALKEIPNKAGLLVVQDIDIRTGFHVVKHLEKDAMYYHRQVVIAKSPTHNKECVKWNMDLRYKLARLGAIKVLAVKNECYRSKYVKKEVEISNG